MPFYVLHVLYTGANDKCDTISLLCLQLWLTVQQNSSLQKTSGGGKDYTDTKNDQRTLALQM